MVPLHIVNDDEPNEGCEFVSVGVSSVSSFGSIVVNGGIHDVSAEAIVIIEESDFMSAILGTEGVSPGGEGGLSPTTAEVSCVGKVRLRVSNCLDGKIHDTDVGGPSAR